MAFAPRRLATFVTVLALGGVGLLPLAGSASAAGLTAPAALAPDNSGNDSTDPTTWQKDPVLSWASVAGASGYQVELSSSDDWTDSTNIVTLAKEGRVPAASFALPQTLDHGNYFWRVRALAGTTLGPWSSDAQLYRGWNAAPAINPTPVTNANFTDWGSDISTAPWRFSWTALPDASSYEIEFSIFPTFPQDGSVQGGNFNDAVKTLDCLTTNTSFSPYGTVAEGDVGVDSCDFSQFNPDAKPIFWRVRGVDDSDASAPGSPQTQVVDCFGTPQENSTEFPNPTVNTPTAFGTPSSAGHECSLWSTTGQTDPLTVQTGADATQLPAPDVSLSCPLVPATTTEYACTGMPEIRWHAVSDSSDVFADSYLVTIADDAALTNAERVYQTSSLTLTPRDQLRDYTAGKGYYVAVAACGSGQCGTASVVTFTKRVPKVTGGTSVHVNGGQRFTWNDLMTHYTAAQTAYGAQALEAKNYLLQLAAQDDPDFSSPMLSHKVDRSCNTALAAACYEPGTADAPGSAESVEHVADGIYLWRVVPVDLSGNHLPASTPQTVSIDTTAPRLHLTNADAMPLTDSFRIKSSEPVVGANGSSVHIIPVTGGPAIAGTLSSLSTTVWTFKPSSHLITGQRYGLAVTAAVQDAVGNSAVVTGAPVRTTRRADDSSVAWNYGAGWTQHSASNALGGTFRSSHSSHPALLKLVGTSVVLYACRGPEFGTLSVFVDGTHRTTVNEHQSFTRCGVLVWKGNVSSSSVHTLKLVAGRGTANVDRVKVG